MPETEFRLLDILKMREVRAATVGTFVVMLGFGIVSPVLPNYARSFGVGYDAVGLLIAGFALTRLIADPFCGRFVDRFGERSMASLGAVIVGVTSIAAALAGTFPLLLVLRSAGGIGSALFFAALLSFLLRVVPAERTGRVMSVYFGAFNVGLIAGAPLGGVIAGWFGLAAPLHVYGVAGFEAAWWFWRSIRSTTRTHEERAAAGWRRLPRNRPFVTALFVNLAYLWFVGSVYSTLVPLFGRDDVHLGLEGVGFAIALATATELVVLFPAGKATDRRGRRAVLVPSLAGLAIVSAALGLTTVPVIFLILMGVLGVASGFAGVPPAPMLGDVTPPDMKGSAVGVFRFCGDLGFVLGPLVAGWTADLWGFPAAFAFTAVPPLVAMALVISIPETMPRGGAAEPSEGDGVVVPFPQRPDDAAGF
jgi:DHA1 family multidrug resistance protein-like MFS transporter